MRLEKEVVRGELNTWRMAILKAIPGRLGCATRNLLVPYRCGTGCTVWDHVHIDEARQVTMGSHVSINRYSILNGEGGITIGDHVLIGPRVIIYSQNHRFDMPGVPFDAQGYIRKSVKIGNDVWLAANVIILPGVTIGDRVVVAAGSVVTDDVPTGSLFAGSPARLVRELA